MVTFYSKIWSQCCHGNFSEKVLLFKMAQKSTQYLGDWKICRPELSEITQSGHTRLIATTCNSWYFPMTMDCGFGTRQKPSCSIILVFSNGQRTRNLLNINFFVSMAFEDYSKEGEDLPKGDTHLSYPI